MGREFDRSVIVGIVLLAALVVTNAAVSYWNTRRVHDDAYLVAHSREVLEAAASVRTNLRTMEASQRFYLLSGNGLEAFRQAEAATREQLARLTTLTGDNADQQARIAELSAAVSLATARLNDTIRVRQAEGLEAAARVVGTGATRAHVADADLILSEFDRNENALLEGRRDDTERAYTNALVFGAASAGFGLLAVCLFVALLGRSVRTRAAVAAAVGREREWLRTTLASIGDAVIATDAAGNVTFLNPVAEALTGWPQADARGQPLTRVFHIVNESTRQQVENPALRALREGVVVGLANHTVLIARDGSERPIDDSAAPIRDVGGTVGGAVLVFRDIRERKTAEEAQARLAAIVESSEDAIVGKTLDGVIRYWNAGAERVFGYAAAEAVGRPITLIIPPERLDEEKSIIARLKRGERIDHFETVRVTKGDRRVDVSLTISPIRDAHGHVIGASKVARDVTERKRVESERARMAETLRLALEAADLGTWDWDPVTDQIALSDRGAAIYGVTPGRTHAREWMRGLLHPAYRDRAREEAVRAVDGRADYDLEYLVDRPEGGSAWVSARGRGVYTPDGRLVRMLGVVQDVTARKEAEAALRASLARNRFLLDLEAATRRLADPAEIMAVSAQLLAEHLGADRCAYAEVEDESVYVITGDYARGVPSIVGRWEVGAFGAEHLRMMRAGERYVVADAADDPRVGPADLPAYHATDIRAVICVPLHKGGLLTAAMAVHQTAPRAWSPEEADLVAAVAGRCWEALERGRVERTLRVSEERFRTLFEAMDEGYCVVEPVFDDAGRATDYRYLLANPALEHHTGLRDVVGKTARGVMPGHESHWIEAYGRVARTGESVRRTERVADLKRWYDVSAFPVGRGQVGVLFSDVTARTEAEESLRASEQRLAEVFRHAPSFMGVLRGPGHVFERANDRYLQLVGGRELVGKTVREALPEVVGQGYVDLLDRVFRTGEPYAATDARVRLEMGGVTEERHVDFVYQPLRDAAGTVTGIIVQGIDQTERARAEAAVRERDERLQLFLGAASDYAVIISGTDDRVTEWLGGAERITGWPGEEVVGQPVSVIFTPEDRSAGVPERETEKATRTGRADNTRWHQRKDGSQFFAEGVTVGIRGPGGELRGFGKVFRDRTDRKRAEDGVRFLADASASLAELVDYESTLRRIANIAVGGFADWCVVDLLEDGRRQRLAVTRTESNEVSAARAEDAPTDGVVPHVLRTGEPEVVTDLTAVDPATAPQGAERVTKLRGLGVQSYLCVPLLSRGRVIGGMTFLSHSARRRFGPDELRVAQDLAGRVTAAIENAQLYRDLQEQDRHKGEFLATLAHELRNPLAPVRNGVTLLKTGLQDAAATERTLGMMDRQLGHMVHLVDDLMDVSRVSSGKVVLRKERVELRAVVDAAVEATRPAVEAGGHELAVSLPPEPLAFDADRTRLTQVLANLLSNAAKYTPPGGRIALTATRDGSEAVIRVADTGVGIPPDMLSKVFDMFTQVGTSLERSQGGLGIGLTLVKRLVEMHGGIVSAESPGPGRGSTFTARLPLAAVSERAEPQLASEEKRVTAPLNILVVDDNRDAAESLALLLEMKGHEVKTVHDGPDALRALGTYRPQLILLDLGLPGMTGYEVARRIRDSRELSGVTLAALTGWGQEEDRRRTKEAGFDYHLVKPADLAELERILNAVGGGVSRRCETGPIPPTIGPAA